MIDLNHTTFIVFCRYDNEERIRNLATMVKFYRKQIKNPRFIFCEERQRIANAPSVLRDVYPLDSDVYCSVYNDDEWNKSAGYNRGIKLAQTEILCFNDVDCIVDPIQLQQAEQFLLSNQDAGMIYPYDGRFLCTNKELKDAFAESVLRSNSLDTLRQHEPQTNEINFSNGMVLVGHNNSCGGIVMARRDSMIRINGYNPHFRGWGYEDSEIPSRAKILGLQNGRVQTGPLWHLFHTTNESSKKETQIYHEQNRQICTQVESMNKEQLEQYITTWKL